MPTFIQFFIRKDVSHASEAAESFIKRYVDFCFSIGFFSIGRDEACKKPGIRNNFLERIEAFTLNPSLKLIENI